MFEDPPDVIEFDLSQANMSNVLIIDDDSTILQIVELTLQSAGHQTTSSVHSEEALHLLETESFDAVVLDLGMPPPDGFSILERLRSSPEHSSIPVVILSARDDPEAGALAIRKGADDYVIKPFEPTELVVRIERLIERNRANTTGLTGRLEALGAADLLQNLCRGRKTGLLLVADSSGTAEVFIHEGQIFDAQIGALRNSEALLALLERESGIFRFEPSNPQEKPLASAVPLNLNQLLMDAAWMQDEIARRQSLLPADDQNLYMWAPLLPASSESDSIKLPLESVHRRLSAQPAMNLAELLALDLASPRQVVLALALLIEDGMVRFEPPAPGKETTTDRLDSEDALLPEESPEERLSRALSKLCKSLPKLQGAAESTQATFHFMLFYDPALWNKLLQVIETIPETLMPVNRPRLLQQLQDRRSGSLRLQGPEGTILVYLQPLHDQLKPRLALSFVTSIIAWIETPEASQKVEDLAKSLTDLASPFGIIACEPSLSTHLRGLFEGVASIQLTRKEPQDFNDLLQALPND